MSDYPLDEKLQILVSESMTDITFRPGGASWMTELLRGDILAALADDSGHIFAPTASHADHSLRFLRCDGPGRCWWARPSDIPLESFLEHRHRLGLVRAWRSANGGLEDLYLIDRACAATMIARASFRGRQGMILDHSFDLEILRDHWIAGSDRTSAIASESRVEYYSAEDLDFEVAKAVLRGIAFVDRTERGRVLERIVFSESGFPDRVLLCDANSNLVDQFFKRVSFKATLMGLELNGGLDAFSLDLASLSLRERLEIKQFADILEPKKIRLRGRRAQLRSSVLDEYMESPGFAIYLLTQHPLLSRMYRRRPSR